MKKPTIKVDFFIGWDEQILIELPDRVTARVCLVRELNRKMRSVNVFDDQRLVKIRL